MNAIVDWPSAPTRPRRLLTAAVLTVITLVAGCGIARDGSASGLVDAYLTAAAESEGDLGWSMLAGSDRGRIFGSEQEYLALSDASSWEAFSWQVVDEHCDDGMCAVWIAVPSAEAIPELLTRGPVLYKEDHVPEGANAVVHVNRRDFFNRGIAMPYG